ncbi:MAG: hypothetical protein ACLPSF_05525 [Methylocella sp.]
MALRRRENSIRFIDPNLPASVEQVAISRLRSPGSRVEPRLRRHGDAVPPNLLDRDGGARIPLIK